MLKLKLLELVEGEKIIDAGAVSQRIERTNHVWVQEPQSRRFKINLSKATAAELNLITKNIGGVVLMDVGEMNQKGAFALYFKSGSEIDLLKAPLSVSPVSAKI